jgi:sRNA-binding carbon storage regulator CsrA
MLSLRRKAGDELTFTITEPCTFKLVVDTNVRLAIDAPDAVQVERPEARIKHPKPPTEMEAA